MILFRVCTIVNDFKQYKRFEESFSAAGFTDQNTIFQCLDNSESNVHEPYSAFNAVLEHSSEPYIIFCHQDIILDQGHDFDNLLDRVKEMDSLFPRWAVLGNAGVNTEFQAIRRITDPYGSDHFMPLPQRVVSLDENFLILHPKTGVRFSSGLRGFHFYGPDICLNAMSRGNTCHVIDFHLTHISGGNYDRRFSAAKVAFEEYWGEYFFFTYLPTVTTTVLLTRFKPLRWLFAKGRVFKYMYKHYPMQYRKKLDEVEPTLCKIG